MSALPLLCAIAAFLSFALATDRYHRARFGRPCTARSASLLRGAGWTLLAVALIPAISIWGAVFGPIAWVGMTMAGAVLVFLIVNLT